MLEEIERKLTKMTEEVEKLIKIQNWVNKNRYHLIVETNLEDKYKWFLFLYFPNKEDYFSSYNVPIMSSDIDSIDDLKKYLETHDGFIGW